MSQLFISDLHLLEARRDITAAYLKFLKERTPSASALYILGDFFELWIGDDHKTDFIDEIVGATAAVTCPKFLMHGNRDFLMGEDLASRMGAELLTDPTVIDLGGKRVLLMHGDSLCTRDGEYMAVRKMLRDPAFQSDFLSKSIEERLAFAESARKQSQAHTSKHGSEPEQARESTDDIMDVTPSEVDRVMREHEVEWMIHGHTHRPKVHREAAGTRIVLGDWDKKGWVLEFQEDFKLEDFKLESFDI